jgi:UPF0148 protein
MREMAEMLRKGAKMLSLSCPECGSPLFQLKNGETHCLKCKREVKIMKEGETPESASLQGSLEKTITRKISLIQRELDEETDPAGIRDLTETLTALLDTLRRVKGDAKN